MKIKISKKLLLVLILSFSFLLRIFRINHPRAHIFDEVYCAFTAQEVAKGNKDAWTYWSGEAPKGFSYGWTHPYLAKEIMAGGVLLFGQEHFAFRITAVVFGVGAVYLTYLLAKELFKKEKVALLAAFLASFEGLMFVMSRTGMLDIFLLFFVLLSALFTLKKKYLISAVSLGLAVSCKWSGIYLFPITGIALFYNFYKNKEKKTFAELISFLLSKVPVYLLVPGIIYLLTYLPFFLYGYSWEQFKNLQSQMWWYHTNLKAEHGYQSAAWSWPLMMRPVWFWVDYGKNTVANIYNLGNPAVFWGGLLALPYVIYRAIVNFMKNKDLKLLLLLFCYFVFWVPWIFSPRIMFLHHYMPALPFLCILLAYVLDKIKPSITNYYLLITVLAFFFFYPIYTGVSMPKSISQIFFWLSSWK